MHDRAVRRRRAVLVVLVAASLILLTAYFGESSGRPPALRAARRARCALADPGGREPRPEAVPRPVRLVRRHDRRQGPARQGRSSRARRAAAPSSPTPQNRAARGRAAGARSTRSTRPAGMDQYGPVDARVYVHSPSSWYQRLQINKGTDDGVKPRRPGDQRRRARRQGRGRPRGGSAVVTLITDQSFATGGIAGDSQRARAASRPPSARPATCCSSSSTTPPRCARATSSTRPGTTVEPPASRATRRRSRSARSTGSTSATASSTSRIHIKPAADLKRVDMVQVLTEPHADLDAQVTVTTASVDPPRPARPARRPAPAQRRLAGDDLRRPGGPHAADGGLRRASSPAR